MIITAHHPAIGIAIASLAYALASGPGHAAVADEQDDFQFPGADSMLLPDQATAAYITYGASAKVRFEGRMQRLTIPYTISASERGLPASRFKVDGDAWQGVKFPANYWARHDSGVWTPAPFSRKARGVRTYYLTYTSVVKGTSSKNPQHCIGVANASSPVGPFTAQARPLVCSAKPNRWSIDADVVQGPQGGFWLTWRDGERAQGADSALSVALLEFNADGKVSLKNQPQVILRGNQVTWESYRDNTGVRVLENPSLYYDNKRANWYLFYSGNAWPTNYYSTGIADCGKKLHEGVLCKPIPGPNRAYFSFAREDKPGFRDALPADMRLKGLPGNKRGPGAMDVFIATDGSPWVTWNYISDDWNGKADFRPRNSRTGKLQISGEGSGIEFKVVQP